MNFAKSFQFMTKVRDFWQIISAIHDNFWELGSPDPPQFARLHFRLNLVILQIYPKQMLGSLNLSSYDRNGLQIKFSCRSIYLDASAWSRNASTRKKNILCVCVCVHKFYENFVCRPLLSFELKFKVPKRRMLLLQIYLQNNINVF